ncbi:MAG: hypothetical protein KY462_10295 [Actinobacteria bacterium]|nr:hypothetical protein [Actinomycetota bacterium]
MPRVGRNEVEAVYFTLLRAREELAELRRYEEYLEAEQRRLQRFVAEGDALEAHVDPRLRRAIAHTDASLTKAIRTRLEVLGDELERQPHRIDAASAFVEECEHDLARLRGGPGPSRE